MQPGITMLESHLDQTYTIIWSLAVANIFGAGLCVLVSRHVAYLTTLPYVYIAPFMILIIFFAGYQSTRHWGDILALLALGVLGTYMRRFGWPRPPLLIGFVLANGAETYLYQAIQFYNWDWLWRPGVMIIAAVTIVSVWAGMRFGRVSINEGGESGVVEKRWPQLAFAVFLAVMLAYAVNNALEQSFLAQVFPLGVSVPSLVGMLAVIAIIASGKQHAVVFDTEAGVNDGRRSMEYYFFWLAGLMVVSAVVGFVIAIAIFFALFLHVNGRAPLGRNAILTASAVLFLAAMSYIFVLDFPGGYLQQAVEMPWPFR
jgi:hypothetical protein